MSDEPEKSDNQRIFGFAPDEKKQVKTTISDKSCQQLDREAAEKEISKSELVRHIIYDYQQKKQQSQSKTR